MPANVDTPEERNESHTGVKKKARGALRHYAAIECESPNESLRAPASAPGPYTYFPTRSKRYTSSGPPSPSYASSATSSAKGSV